MKQRLITGALLLRYASAHASLLSWRFSYTGYFDQRAVQFLADATIRGSFKGNDLNGAVAGAGAGELGADGGGAGGHRVADAARVWHCAYSRLNAAGSA